MRSRHLVLIVLALLAGWVAWELAGGGAGEEGAPVLSDEAAAPGPAGGGAEVAPPDLESQGALARELAAAEPGAAPLRASPPLRDEIHGRVLHPDRTPAVSAQVRLWELPEREFGLLRETDSEGATAAGTIQTGADGTFRFDGPLAGNFRVEAESGGFLEHRFPVPAGDYVEILLGSGCRIEGTVLCASHDAEVFEGEVWLARSWFDVRLLGTPILPSGTFTFPSVSPGTHTVLARIAGHAVDNPLLQANLTTWGEIARVELTVAAGLVIEGRVLDEVTERPIAGATVWVTASDEASQITDPDGRFRFVGIRRFVLDLGDIARIFSDAPGYASGETALVTGADCLIRMKKEDPPPLRITGRLLDQEGRPVAGAKLEASGRKQDDSDEDADPFLRNLRESEVTEPSGRFVIPWDAGLDTSINITSAAQGTNHLILGVIRADRDLGDLHLPATAVWDLRFTDEAGFPVAGAEVFMSQSISIPDERFDSPEFLLGPLPYITPTRTTDSFGRCRIVSGPMEDGTIGVSLGENGHWLFSLPSSDGNEQVLELEDLRQVPVRILDSSGDLPPFLFLSVIDPVESRGIQADLFEEGDVLFPSQDGRFLIQGRYPRAVALRLDLPGPSAVGTVVREGVALDAGPVEIVLPEFLPVAGIVQDAAGRPLPGATLLRLLGSGRDAIVTRTDKEGRFAIRILPDARVQLFAQDENDRRSETVEIAAGAAGVVLTIRDEQ